MTDAAAPRAALPPFDAETAALKVRAAEDARNTRDPDRVAGAHTPDSRWRNRAEFPVGRDAIRAFLAAKRRRALDHRLIQDLWPHGPDRIAVRFADAWRAESGRWLRSHGAENWRFDALGALAERHASLDDQPIAEADRLFRWPPGPRPADHPGPPAVALFKSGRLRRLFPGLTDPGALAAAAEALTKEP